MSAHRFYAPFFFSTKYHESTRGEQSFIRFEKVVGCSCTNDENVHSAVTGLTLTLGLIVDTIILSTIRPQYRIKANHVNTRPTQGKKLWVMHSEVMGILAEYYDDVKRRRAHPLLMLKVDSKRISSANGEVLETITIVEPIRSPAKRTKRIILQGDENRSILPQVRPTAKQRSVLEVDKHAPGEDSR